MPPFNLTRFLVLQLHLALLFAALALTHAILKLHEIYNEPYLMSLRWSDERMEDESTYGFIGCGEQHITTSKIGDILLHKDSFAANVDSMMHHGVGFIQAIVPFGPAAALRDHILQRNDQLTEEEDANSSTAARKQHLLLAGTEHTSIPHVLRSIALHATLTNTLEGLLGGNPALVEFSAITLAAGARSQAWHRDVWLEASASAFGKTFSNRYSLVIPLQDASFSMSSIAVCPGTHRCYNGTSACQHKGFNISEADGSKWKVGSGLLYHSAMLYRYGTNFGGEGIVALVLSFASRPDYPYTFSKYSRMLPVGPQYSLRFDMHSFTLRDMEDASKYMAFPGNMLRALGISKPDEADWGWTYTRAMGSYITNDAGESIGRAKLVDLNTFLSSILPTSLLTKNDNGAQNYVDWPQYISSLLQNLRTFLIVICLPASMFVTAVVVLNGHEMDTKFPVSFVMHLLFPVACGVLMGGALFAGVSGSTWARNIRSGRLAASPFPGQHNIHFSEDYVEEATAINHDDVLFGARLDDPLLASQSRFLYYHPGNRQLNLEMDDFAALFLAYQPLPFIFQDALLDCLLEGRTFVEENEFGDWFELDHEEVRSVIAQTLVAKWANPGYFLPYGGLVLTEAGPCSNKIDSKLCQFKTPLNDVLFGKHNPIVDLRQNSNVEKFAIASSLSRPKMRRCVPYTKSGYATPYFDKISTNFRVGDSVDALYYKARYPWSRGDLQTRKWLPCTIRGISEDYSTLIVFDATGEQLVLGKTEIRKKILDAHRCRLTLYRTKSYGAIWNHCQA